MNNWKYVAIFQFELDKNMSIVNLLKIWIIENIEDVSWCYLWIISKCDFLKLSDESDIYKIAIFEFLR